MLLRNGCNVFRINLCRRTELHGSLSPALCELPELKVLDLKGTKVSGDLAMLASCKRLITLDLSKTNVAGDLKALENVVELKYLSLSGTKVEGDIKALQNATGLFHLYLENTNVSGDMASLREAKQLKYVKIGGSRITGGRCSPRLFQSFCLVPLLAPASAAFPTFFGCSLAHGRHHMWARRRASPAGAAWSGPPGR